ncbi:DNA repair protein RadA [candidate division CPR3 bacterium GWF2_35_18]|uniref:DNA repair protein RadA n=1 Tax=candidate division CPR3 bacterium GW2011_GWF2_35_18 TaxID=1618350 RepID=A0A0G0E3G3_UNCC3|nr:MAG: repair protein radA protein [candidate division CPR3 bacterium GW2011_GWF2_35_18]KKP85996.1 MAG: repair protein radA protein [candidate division CPR3 bacterium GW2011_GWE2_35_7]OGB63718.1 MAG: DNA repair protein RadA [candidate division CPR3 bacterium GWF2_35_18]OGB64962.1 MAG: DNA repair protein RadA [candidate division CPR3 bacterium RIFOXYA2_FULL_35_13]OGB76560.1 MAG: DNA repair protein RadA [candidate division CPR3 bacterium RIFOXYC2_FULL_35_7]OGB78637.1 MAG: DNA repair protein Rad
MGKQSTVFICQNCGSQYTSWMGRCSNCNQWNTLIEEIKEEKESVGGEKKGKMQLLSLSSISSEKITRIATGFSEFDLILGGGIVKGSLILLSGEPGVGKSTLLLQLVQNLLNNQEKFQILYISGEESPEQIKIRAERLENSDKNLTTDKSLLVASETIIEKIITSIEEEKPSLLIIDSIQTVFSEKLNSYPGSVSQVRFCANEIMRAIKRLKIPTFIVGQVTKEGIVAGPKVLEHLVDVVLQIEGGEAQDFRLLRSLKNRFGNTDEIGIFQMGERGLTEVKNPSAVFLDEHESNIPGSVKTVFLEGKRCLLAEIQALIVPNYFPPLRRTATGIDYNRLLLLVAVLERRLGLKLQNKDIYIKVSGGLKLQDPAIDLAVCGAIISAYQNKVLSNNIVMVGEIGLLGEVRGVSQLNKRIKEANKQGFKNVYSSQSYKNLLDIQKVLNRD